MLPLNTQQIKARYDQALRRLTAGQLDQARAEFTELLRDLPNSAEVQYQLSRIAHQQGDRAGRAHHLTKALSIKPTEKALNDAAVEAFTATGDFDQALAAHDRLIAAAPTDIKLKVDKGLTLQFAGRFDDAEVLFRALIRKHPDTGALYRIFLATQKLALDDPLMTNMRRLIANPRAPDQSKMHASFAMAKALGDQGVSDKVFTHLDRANALQRKLYPYDRAAHEAEHAGMIAAQDGADLTPIGSQMAVRPVFVTGLPRSGTTLVEQIIASHSDVTAGGELAHAVRLAIGMLGDGKTLSPLDSVPSEKLSAFTKAYASHVRRDTGATSGVVTDKSMLNHLIYGLLHRAMPGARMIVVHRDPRDIALSIYRNHFAVGTHRYANDLADIAAVIKAFRANVAQWRARLPTGVLHEVRYEDLVTDPEPQVRALIAAAGLDWQDQCLEFHRAKGTVKTLSLHQVRQPIHTGAIQGWRKFETELAPFIAAWGDAPWD